MTARKGSDAQLKRILSELAPREREALDRFFRLEQTTEQISIDLHMNIKQLRTLMSRVKMAYFATRKTN